MTFEDALDIVGHANADLVGRTLTLGGKDWTVERAPDQPAHYVYLTRTSDGEGNEDKQDMILRPAGLVRQHLRQKEDDAA
jgi:hypothetical protein